MSGPCEPSWGRAENANHVPSGEYAAASPTTMTSRAICNVPGDGLAGTVVAGGVADAVTTGVGLADGLDVASADVLGVGATVGVGESTGVDVATGVVDGVGDVTGLLGDADGVGLVGGVSDGSTGVGAADGVG